MLRRRLFIGVSSACSYLKCHSSIDASITASPRISKLSPLLSDRLASVLWHADVSLKLEAAQSAIMAWTAGQLMAPSNIIEIEKGVT